MTAGNPTAPRPPFFWKVRVYYEDTDVSAVVYHAVYLKYLERARTEWLRTQGFSQEKLKEQLGLVFTVANIEVDFVKPARLDDELDVAVHVTEVRRASLRFEQTIARRGEVLCRARVRVGSVDYANFKPCALPEAFARHLEKESAGVSA